MQVVNKILSLEVKISKNIELKASDLFPLYISIDFNWSGKKMHTNAGLKKTQNSIQIVLWASSLQVLFVQGSCMAVFV